mmetsp:Transcript_42915/g.101899  ORF Transcript_42915/g.101899 Transcript_42915/m.101899 type:complete len:177 (-) Transcript_42915:241-771(-)
MSSNPAMLQLSKDTGFCILEAWVTPDLRRARLRWDAYPRKARAAEAGLSRRMNWLRGETSRRLGARFMPWLEFRRAGPTAEQAEVERALARWAQEQREEAAARGHAPGGGLLDIEIEEENEAVSRAGEDRIRETMQRMVREGASEEEIRARVEREVRAALEEAVHGGRSAGGGGAP